MAHADAVMSCPRDDRPLAALAGAMERREEGPNDDRAFANNAVAADAIAYACGRIARPDAEDHSHDDEEEAARCNELSRELAAELAGFWVGGLVGDEGGARWTPFCAPITTEEEIPAVIDAAYLREVTGGALYPLLPFAVSSLDAALAARTAENGDEGGGADQLRVMLNFYRKHDMSQPTLLNCTNGYLREAHYFCCMLPCFVLAITGKGSLVGVVGAVVRT